MLSTRFKWLLILCIGGFGFGILGCARVSSTTSTQPNWNRHKQNGEIGSVPVKPSPRALASLRLTDQGRLFLENGNPDDAIRMYEKALNLDPANGPNYYYLSEAWIMKGNIAQAAEFNRLAAIYLEGDAKWMDRVMQQRERIKKTNHKKW
jgi:tetratricopeptide (TPR) repeat protein